VVIRNLYISINGLSFRKGMTTKEGNAVLEHQGFQRSLLDKSPIGNVSLVLLIFQLKQLGHSVDKVEFIVMGGTFMALPEDYRDYFIRNLHDALSGHTSNNVAEAVR